MMLSVNPIYDPALINAILRDPWIAARLRHDEREPGYIADPNLTYHVAREDGRIAGIFMAIRHTVWEVEVHAALAKWATRYGRDLGRMFLDVLWQEPDLMRVTAPVLSTLPSAANYCRRLGFRDEGVKRAACRIDGAVVNVVMLGMVREESAAKKPDNLVQAVCDQNKTGG